MERLKMLIPTDFSVQAEFAYLMVKKFEEKTPPVENSFFACNECTGYSYNGCRGQYSDLWRN
jgi:hypothetical protein